MKIPITLVIGAVVALGLGAYALRDQPLLRDAAQAVHLPAGDATPATGPTLAAAGVHKCRGAAGIVYSDRPCPKGSTELVANGGAVTVVAFPRLPPPAASRAASGLVQGFSREEVERLRDREIEAAANR